MNRAVFLDRDGTLIVEKGYICDFSEVEIFPFAFEAVRLMREHHFKVIVVTNQSAVARGICRLGQVEDLHRCLREEFINREAPIEKIYYCPYLAGGKIKAFQQDHPWRKPRPGMLLQAAADFDIDLSRSYMMGDDLIDLQAGKWAGCKTVLVLTGKGAETEKRLEPTALAPDLVSPNILTAIRKVVQRLS
jgi:D-glycero-D-manno-heptose 1,7-bisphosphate phosphatase